MYVDNYEVIVRAFDADIKQSFYIKEGDKGPLLLLDLLFMQKDFMIENLTINPDYQTKIDTIDTLISQIQENCLNVIETADANPEASFDNFDTCEYPTILSDAEKYAWYPSSKAPLSLTTEGNSGAATYDPNTGILNIPIYTLDALGYKIPTLDEVTTQGNETENEIKVGGLYTEGNVTAAKHITINGTKDDFVKGDGSISNIIDGGSWNEII